MAQITINIPDDKISRVTDAYSLWFGWSEETGLTKAQFTKRQIIKQIKQTVKTVEGDNAANAQRVAIETDIENISIT